MKKSLLALAVLGAFAGAASAQTNVTIYGVVDAGIAFDNGGAAAGKTWKLQSGQQNGSRIGFKGTEDLGGGLSASFTLENGFATDDGTLGNSPAGTNRLFGRQAWVGLNGGFGSVKLGRQYTPLYNSALAVDPFGLNLSGNLQKAFGYGLYNVDPLSRADNTISYTTVNLSGFTGSATYSFGEQAGNFSANNNFGAGLSYANGPINAQLAYNKVHSAGLTLTGNLAAEATTALGAGATTPDVRTWFLGGTYDFGVAKLHAAYGDTKVETAATSTKDRNYMLGVSAPVGAAGRVLASWIRNDLKDISSGKSDQYAIGYTHALSKRTSLYTSAGYTKNDDRVRLNAATLGDSDRNFQVGVTHLF